MIYVSCILFADISKREFYNFCNINQINNSTTSILNCLYISTYIKILNFGNSICLVHPHISLLLFSCYSNFPHEFTSLNYRPHQFRSESFTFDPNLTKKFIRRKKRRKIIKKMFAKMQLKIRKNFSGYYNLFST